jgi:ATP-dependent helicase/nuclease subunit A
LPTELVLPFDDNQPRDRLLARDETAREHAVDPARNVVLEASAGTGKTRVLVTRYVNLLRAGVDPANVLAITFTRKAASEMRERILAQLREMSARSAADAARWRALRDRLGDIGIGTIDAFCLSLLREFPLEADLDPGFAVADETEVPRFVDEALDAALRAARRLVRTDEDVALLLAALGERKVRAGLGGLLDRRLVADSAIRRFLGIAPAPPPGVAFGQALSRLAALFDSAAGGSESFLADGPIHHPGFALVQADLRALGQFSAALQTGALADPAAARPVIDRLSAYFLAKDGGPRKRPAPGFLKEHCPSADAWKRHSQAVSSLSPYVAETLDLLERDLNRAMARAAGRLFRIARRRYRQALESQARVDFSDALGRTLAMLRRMDEFAQSRYRLEARYHHVLVDEFQDTSRAQWQLVARLVESWGEGIGLAHDAPLQPSVFVVGDRKQSIYGFRDADVRMLRRARRYIRGLRPGGEVRRTIARSFRSAPELLEFANDVFAGIDKVQGRADAFRYSDADRFPVRLSATSAWPHDALGVVAGSSSAAVASQVAAEVERLLASAQVRDRQTGLAREARPGDVAILFRSRESHREYERALESRRIATYVYKGLGFFDADEVKDLVALLRFLADPSSDSRAAAFLRSRFVRLSDEAIRRLAPALARGLAGGAIPPGLGAEDQLVLRRLRASLPGWLARVDRVPPAEIVDQVLEESAYAFELRGRRETQARENVKKVRALLRRIQNRGYSTLPRIAGHLDRLSAGDESNAVVDAADAVNLMTVHAAKGLEFPIVFLVNLGRGTGSHGDPILVVSDPRRREPLVSIGGGLPDAEAAVRARDLEETKRLLYVAVTRARERLYLSAVVKDGRLKAGRGSLAEILPPGVRALIERAAADPSAGRIEWQAPGGAQHRFAVPPPVADGGTAGREEGGTAGGEKIAASIAMPGDDKAPSARSKTDFAEWRDAAAVPRAAVARAAIEAAAERTESAGAFPEEPPNDRNRDRAAARIVGTLVHRLFQVCDRAQPGDEAAVARRALGLTSPEELADLDEPGVVAHEAAAAFLALRRRPDVASLLDAATCLYEVPFSLLVPPDGIDRGATVMRGTIDCVARLPGGRVVVVEVKTGQPRSWHQAQLERYLAAARAIFPAERVEGVVLYG